MYVCASAEGFTNCVFGKMVFSLAAAFTETPPCECERNKREHLASPDILVLCRTERLMHTRIFSTVRSFTTRCRGAIYHQTGQPKDVLR